MAQKLIVVRQDRGAVPALKSLAESGGSPLGRLHAMWTLEGLGVFDTDLIFKKTQDLDARVRAAVVRLCEPELLKRNTALLAAIKPLASDADIDVAIQVVLSMGLHGSRRRR